MSRRFFILVFLVLGFTLINSPALPCSLCALGPRSKTLREDVAQAKLIVCGTLANSRLTLDKQGMATGGATELHIHTVVKDHSFLSGRRVVELPRYVPCDPKNPPKYAVFCDIFNGRLDPYRGVPIQSADFLNYLKGMSRLDRNDSTGALLYYFNFLDHTDSTIADDAFLEFAKANDQEIGLLAGKLAARKLRIWVHDPQTPAPRLNLYGFLLGACGDAQDAELLHSLIIKSSESNQAALSGLLSGYITLRPKEGWQLAANVLADTRQPYGRRLAVLGAIRFFHSWKEAETRDAVLSCIAGVLAHGDMADLVIEDLRRWQLWQLTRDVLVQFDKPTHSAPIMRRAIIRYALSCPNPEAKDFAGKLKKQDPGLVAEVEESLQFEKDDKVTR